MRQADIDRLNMYFSQKRGSEVCFANCIEEHDCLVIGFFQKDQAPVGVSFFYSKYVCGPIRWTAGRLECSLFKFDDGEFGIEVEDQAANFVIRAYGPVKLGDTGEIVPTK